MKKHIMILLCVGFLTLSACHRDEPPSPSTQHSTMTTQAQSLVGDWILDSTQDYANGVYVMTTPHNDPANCYLHLQSSACTYSAGNYNAVAALQCTSSVCYWNCNTGNLILQTVYYPIITLTQNSLVIQWGSITAGGGGAYLYYLHK